MPLVYEDWKTKYITVQPLVAEELELYHNVDGVDEVDGMCRRLYDEYLQSFVGAANELQ